MKTTLQDYLQGLSCVEKLAAGNFFEDYVAKIIHLWGALNKAFRSLRRAT